MFTLRTNPCSYQHFRESTRTLVMIYVSTLLSLQSLYAEASDC